MGVPRSGFHHQALLRAASGSPAPAARNDATPIAHLLRQIDPNELPPHASDMLPDQLTFLPRASTQWRNISCFSVGWNGGRDKDRTCDPYDVNVGQRQDREFPSFASH